MEGASDALMAVMSDIVDKAQQLVKNKISKLPIAANQQTGPPTITNPPVRPTGQSSTDDKTTKKRTQQYAEWNTREYTSSKDGRQKRVDIREEQRAKAQMESAKRDMLIYKQMVYELKTVLETKKDKKVRKAIVMEIQANENIIKTMIRLGVPDVPLPREIELKIMVDKSKTGTQTGSKSPWTQAQAMMEGDKDVKKVGEGAIQSGRKGAANPGRPEELSEEEEDENDRVKNHGNRLRIRRTECEETEGDKVENCNKHTKGKADEGDEEEDDVINCKNPYQGGRGARKGRKGSDKVSNCKQASADMMDLFALLDFLDDDEEDDDYEPPVRKRRTGKAVPLIEDDDDDDENEEGENDDGDNDDNEEEDEDYEVDNDGDDDKEDEDEEEDDEEITLQAGKAEQRKCSKPVAVAKSKHTSEDVIIEERRMAGQRCANVSQATKFRKYIHDVMKTFEEHVRKGKQVKKYLLEMIEDVREACANMRYPRMDFDPEEIIPMFSDPSFKAWRAKLSEIEFADRNDLKEANTRHNSNMVTSDRRNKDVGQIAQTTLDKLPTAQRNDCKQMLKHLIKYNTEAYESAAKAGRELMGLLDYFPILAWLQVADAMTRPLVYVQVPEVVEIVRQAQDVIDKKKPKEGESPIDEIVEEQNLPDMMLLSHVWGYGRDDVGKKTVSAIIYKYLKEQMFPKAHVTTAFLSVKFATTSSTLHKYIVRMKYRGGVPPGSKSRQGKSEEWTRKQREDDVNKDASGSGVTRQEVSKGKGARKENREKEGCGRNSWRHVQA